LVPTLISRITRIEGLGLKLELDEAVSSSRRIASYIYRLTRDIPQFPGSARKRPAELRELSGREKYAYEQLTWHLYNVFETVKDPNDLSTTGKEDFRALVKNSYRGAREIGYNTKALDVIKYLQKFKDRDLDQEELIMTGNAYVWAAEEADNRDEQKILRKNAVSFLKKGYYAIPLASEKANVAYNVGLMLLHLEEYKSSISWMRRCIALAPEGSPEANWTIACAYAKLGAQDQTLNTLNLIHPTSFLTARDWSELWNNIENDDYFSVLRQPPEDASFRDLIARKRAEKPHD
jgi:tetratricopeptide (TPR) repeat protein